MSKMIKLGLLMLLCGGVVNAQSLDDLIGPQYSLVMSMQECAAGKKYDCIYNLLSEQYRSVVQSESFKQTLLKGDWTLENLDLGTIRSYPAFSYAPVRADVLYEGRRLVIHSVFFFMLEEGEWTILNFPFLPAGLPEFGESPPFEKFGVG